MPYLLSKFINLSTISAIGGTGAILVVGISLEIINTLETQVASEKYKGWF
jgi:preprotein translocase subunit SecY